jgi:ubiquinone/menaquinone biosynthesis C-methylase UbiE
LLYRYPVGHKAGFNIALSVVTPTAQDVILDVGCGCGVFLQQALLSGCRGTGVDHSLDMLSTARRVNAKAVRDGCLALIEGDAAALPLLDGSFDKVFCLNAFFFFPDPAAAVAEMARVAKNEGSVAILTMQPDWARQFGWLFGPVTQHMRCDEPAALERWGSRSGLSTMRIVEIPSGGYLHVFRKHDGGRTPSSPLAL